MIKSTPELEAKIKASGVPVIEISLEQFQKAKITKEKPSIYKQNNGNTNNRQSTSRISILQRPNY